MRWMQQLLAGGAGIAERHDRAQGCLLGQLAGDSLGSLVEFQSPRKIRSKYPSGVRNLADGGTFNTLAGQPTDDSEMALGLARMLAERGEYDPGAARVVYVDWLESGPFDCGGTISGALRGRLNPDSQANGAMMRISPLGIFGVNYSLAQTAEWARQDAALTHPNPVCVQANALYVMAIAWAIATGPDPVDLYRRIAEWAEAMEVEPSLMATIREAALAPPEGYMTHQGWVLIAFHNALWQLHQARSLEEAVVDTVMGGGDTDTNGTICGALLGAVQGRDVLPAQWVESILNCRPGAGRPGVHRPRPERFWPVDAPDLVDRLLAGSSA